MFPGVCAYVSQIDGPLPSSFHAPSIWYAEVAVPQKNPLGNSRAVGLAGSAPVARAVCAAACVAPDEASVAAAAAFATSRRVKCVRMDSAPWSLHKLDIRVRLPVVQVGPWSNSLDLSFSNSVRSDLVAHRFLGDCHVHTLQIRTQRSQPR